MLQAAERQESLGFTCMCEACRPGPAHDLGEARRLLIRGAQFVFTGEDLMEGRE
jgi:hypothetical protein